MEKAVPWRSIRFVAIGTAFKSLKKARVLSYFISVMLRGGGGCRAATNTIL
jgi:hypothetical protein